MKTMKKIKALLQFGTVSLVAAPLIACTVQAFHKNDKPKLGNFQAAPPRVTFGELAFSDYYPTVIGDAKKAFAISVLLNLQEDTGFLSGFNSLVNASLIKNPFFRIDQEIVKKLTDGINSSFAAGASSPVATKDKLSQAILAIQVPPDDITNTLKQYFKEATEILVRDFRMHVSWTDLSTAFDEQDQYIKQNINFATPFIDPKAYSEEMVRYISSAFFNPTIVDFQSLFLNALDAWKASEDDKAAVASLNITSVKQLIQAERDKLWNNPTGDSFLKIVSDYSVNKINFLEMVSRLVDLNYKNIGNLVELQKKAAAADFQATTFIKSTSMSLINDAIARHDASILMENDSFINKYPDAITNKQFKITKSGTGSIISLQIDLMDNGTTPSVISSKTIQVNVATPALSAITSFDNLTPKPLFDVQVNNFTSTPTTNDLYQIFGKTEYDMFLARNRSLGNPTLTYAITKAASSITLKLTAKSGGDTETGQKVINFSTFDQNVGVTLNNEIKTALESPTTRYYETDKIKTIVGQTITDTQFDNLFPEIRIEDILNKDEYYGYNLKILTTLNADNSISFKLTNDFHGISSSTKTLTVQIDNTKVMTPEQKIYTEIGNLPTIKTLFSDNIRSKIGKSIKTEIKEMFGTSLDQLEAKYSSDYTFDFILKSLDDSVHTMVTTIKLTSTSSGNPVFTQDITLPIQSYPSKLDWITDLLKRLKPTDYVNAQQDPVAYWRGRKLTNTDIAAIFPGFAIIKDSNPEFRFTFQDVTVSSDNSLVSGVTIVDTNTLKHNTILLSIQGTDTALLQQKADFKSQIQTSIREFKNSPILNSQGVTKERKAQIEKYLDNYYNTKETEIDAAKTQNQLSNLQTEFNSDMQQQLSAVLLLSIATSEADLNSYFNGQIPKVIKDRLKDIQSKEASILAELTSTDPSKYRSLLEILKNPQLLTLAKNANVNALLSFAKVFESDTFTQIGTYIVIVILSILTLGGAFILYWMIKNKRSNTSGLKIISTNRLVWIVSFATVFILGVLIATILLMTI